VLLGFYKVNCFIFWVCYIILKLQNQNGLHFEPLNVTTLNLLLVSFEQMHSWRKWEEETHKENLNSIGAGENHSMTFLVDLQS
jgi:hypothetical protein